MVIRRATALPRVAKEIAELTVNDQNSLLQLSQIAVEMLAGEIAGTRKDVKQAIAHLRRGAAIEDALTYSEPPDWPLPVRHSLGAVLLEAGGKIEETAKKLPDVSGF